jgi:hypothetical protein
MAYRKNNAENGRRKAKAAWRKLAKASGMASAASCGGSRREEKPAKMKTQPAYIIGGIRRIIARK